MWRRHDADDTLAKPVRIAQPQERSGCQLGADLVVTVFGEAGLRVVVQPAVAAPPGGLRLAEIVEEGGEPHRERMAQVGRGLDYGEGVLVNGEIVVAALLVEADRRAELR